MSDILILSNGPGEVTTWVLPVVKSLRQELGETVRISVVLSPCPHATGKEAAIASSFPEVDRVLPPESFLSFLLWGKTPANWHWRDTGVVLFLGGDQFYSLVIGKRLAYPIVVYAEWDARWYRYIDAFGVMKESTKAKVSAKYQHKVTVVGDLMAQVGNFPPPTADTEIIGLLTGSKASKLAQGVPLCLAIADQIHRQRPHTRFIIPVAPSIDIDILAKFANPANNPLVNTFGNLDIELVRDEIPFFQTAEGLKVELITTFPAYDILSQCRLCLTTVGANTAQLASLAIPMIVLLPTQQLDAMRTWDGIPGILANLPGVGSSLAKLINWLVLKQGRLFAWPNIWAGEEIVPELVGRLSPMEVAKMVIDFLEHPEKLSLMGDRLKQVSPAKGADVNITNLVCKELRKKT